MRAGETTFLGFIGSENQFLIPIFQRTYNWKERQCQQLWNDVLYNAQESPDFEHFMGSIVYVQDEQPIIGSKRLSQLLIIDGQQRLVTIILLLKALSCQLNGPDTDPDGTYRTINNYLFNNNKVDEMRYKLILTKSDKETLNNLLDDKALPSDSSSRIIENYEFFEEKIRSCEIGGKTILNAIERLSIVGISLDRRFDNPQLIFESLNSTGMDLSQADLIRNYVLMGLKKEEQDALYKDYWFPLEQTLETDDDTHLLDKFLRDYITAKTGKIPNFDEIYPSFKMYIAKQYQTTKEIMVDVLKFSEYYARMALLQEDDVDIKGIIEDINRLEMYVSYPFLLLVYDDYANDRIIKNDFLEILKLLESYVFRRYICGIATAGLNKIFATLYRDIDTKNRLKSLESALLNKDTNRRFPSDEEFKNQFLKKDIYNTRNCKYLLEKLENYKKREKIDCSNYTIEHIMPRNENLSEKWRNDLGPNWKEIQAIYLHTIGNLTLTGYNSNLSDRSFIDKRDMDGGFKKSPFTLNRMLAESYYWNEEKILERANNLIGLAIKIWKSPTLDNKSTPKDPYVNPPKGPVQIVEVPEPLKSVFFSGEDYKAARELIEGIFKVINYESSKRILSLYCSDIGVMIIRLGPLEILKFINYRDQHLEVVFPINFDIYDNKGITINYIENLPRDYSDAVNIRMVRVPWSNTTDLPEKFYDAWHSAIKWIYNQFESWDPSQSRISNEPSLVEIVIQDRR